MRTFVLVLSLFLAGSAMANDKRAPIANFGMGTPPMQSEPMPQGGGIDPEIMRQLGPEERELFMRAQAGQISPVELIQALKALRPPTPTPPNPYAGVKGPNPGDIRDRQRQIYELKRQLGQAE